MTAINGLSYYSQDGFEISEIIAEIFLVAIVSLIVLGARHLWR